jgi:TonB family protein
MILFVSQFTYAAGTNLKFTNSTLNDVLNELSKFYSINFIYQDELVEGKQVTCNLSDQNSDTAIKEIQAIADLSMEKINDNTYVLYQKPGSSSGKNKKGIAGSAGINTPVLIPPRAISDITIPYPELAKVSGSEGSVDMKILINENGDVETVKIEHSSNSIILDRAAMEYAKKIKFVPAYIDERPISVWTKWKVIYDLIPSDSSYSRVSLENIKE